MVFTLAKLNLNHGHARGECTKQFIADRPGGRRNLVRREARAPQHDRAIDPSLWQISQIAVSYTHLDVYKRQVAFWRFRRSLSESGLVTAAVLSPSAPRELVLWRAATRTVIHGMRRAGHLFWLPGSGPKRWGESQWI